MGSTPGGGVEVLDPGDPQQVAASLCDRFTADHGMRPAGVFAAPGRVNLMGEHTDYNDGLCLPAALPHAAYVAMRPREDGVLSMASRQAGDELAVDLADIAPGTVSGWPAYVAGVAWALREEGFELPGMDLVVDSRVPIGAGLSSSAALECAAALAMCGAAGAVDNDRTRAMLVRCCVRAETEVAGAPTGGMDQTAALFAAAGHAMLLDCRDGSTRQLPWTPEASGVTLLAVDTRARHDLTDGDYGARRRECEAAADRLGVASLRELPGVAAPERLADPVLRRRARHVVSEIQRVREAVAAIEGGDVRALGRLLDASHASLRDDFEVSCQELDRAVEAAREAGALGARMIGGGFGGSAIALVPSDRVPAVRRTVAAAFAGRGWPAPRFLGAPAAAGAREVVLAGRGRRTRILPGSETGGPTR